MTTWAPNPFVYVVNLVWDLLGSLMPLHSPHFVCKRDVGTIKAEVALNTVSEITQPVEMSLAETVFVCASSLSCMFPFRYQSLLRAMNGM